MGAHMSTDNEAGTPTGAGGAPGGGNDRPEAAWPPPRPEAAWPPPRPDAPSWGPPRPDHGWAPPPPSVGSTIPASSAMPPPMPPYPPGTPYYGYYPPMPPRRRHRLRKGVALAALVAVSVGAGVGLDHAFWRASATPVASAGGSTTPQFGGNGGTGGFGSGGSTGGSGGSTGGSGGVSGGGSSTPTGVAAKVDPELVDINTTLGYQDIQAAGTGIVLTSNGEILTNNHVIAGATTITATDIGNGKTYTATVVGYDRTGDVAVLQLKSASGLATASLADSSKVAVGAAVTGIGNAGGTGLTPTAAAGSITGINQSVTASDEVTGSAEQLSGMLQTNADIQPGDSGGPLVNSSGAVVGMDTAGSESASGGSGAGGGFQQGGGEGSSGGDSGGSQGSAEGTQGFAIPINTALNVVHQIEAGSASSTVHVGATAFIGVEVSTATGASTTSGASVSGVIPNSPAAQAGLAQGDDITSVDGQSVASANSLTTLMASQKAGSKVTVSWTDAAGATHSASITLASGPAN